MPCSVSNVDQVGRRTTCAERLRARVDEVVDAVVPRLMDAAEPLRQIPPDIIAPLVRGYVMAMADAIACDSIAPLQAFLEPIDEFWVPSGLTPPEIIRAIYLVNDACQEATACEYGDRCPLVERMTRESVALVAERAVSALTGQLTTQLAEQEQAKERLISLQRVSTALASDLDLDRTLEVVVQEARQLMQAAAAVIWVLDEDEDLLRVIASDGSERFLTSVQTLPVEGTLVGHCLGTRSPVICDDAQADPRISRDGQPDVRAVLMVPLAVHDRAIGVLVVTDRRVGAFGSNDQRLMEFFAEQAATAIEHARLFQRAQGQIAELAALQRISSVISSSLKIDDVFTAIYDEIRKVMPVDAFFIGLARDDGLFDIEFVIDGGQRYAARHGLEIGPSLSLGRVISERTPVVVGDVRDRQRPDMHIVGNPDTEVRSVLAAPLLRGSEVVGIVSAQSYTPHIYRKSDADLLMTIANHAVVAIEHARLYAQAQSLAVAEERNRLAREIHDTLAQGLIGIILLLERLDLALPTRETPAHELLNRAAGLARANLEEARRSVRDLRAAPLEGRTLLEALQHLVEELRGEDLFEIQLQSPVTLPHFAARVETALFRVAQEALTNCQKHGECSNVQIEIGIKGDILHLEIADDGKGFDLGKAAANHHRFGLSSMRERVEQIGGELRIESQPGRGTRIRAELPVHWAIYSESSHTG